MAISAVHPDIIQTHILIRLDGPTLASAGCASPLLHSLCTEEKLWTDVTNSTWPSTDHPSVHEIISTFPAGHRSFFAEAFQKLDHRRHRLRRPSQPENCLPLPTSELISAVDIHYKNKAVFSKVEVTETLTEWVLCSPFRIDFPLQKETVKTPVKFEVDTCRSNIENYMALSWIVIDPTRKRAVNLSSRRPVSVERHWLTGDVQVRYATVIAGDDRVGSSEFVQCGIVVTCGGEEAGDLHVKEVSFELQDLDGKSLCGKESLVILQEAMQSGRKKKGERGEERERYEEYLDMKRDRIERKQRREKNLDMACIATVFTIFFTLAFVLLR